MSPNLSIERRASSKLESAPMPARISWVVMSGDIKHIP